MQLADLFAERARDARPFEWEPEPEGDIVSLAYGLADPALFPREELVEAAAQTATANGSRLLNYASADSLLIDQIVAHLQQQGIASADRKQVLLGYGSSEIINILPLVLVEPGDAVIVEAPTFLGAVNRFRASGAQLIGVPVGSLGMDLVALETTLRELQASGRRAKFIYTIPTFQNPTGTTMPLAERQRLVELAAEYGTLLVEDDAYGELRFRGVDLPPLAALSSEWVLRMSTFSKILAPGLRLGYAYGPLPLIERLAAFKTSGGGGPFLTGLVARYCADGRLAAHVAALRALYARKCAAMIAAIEQEFPAEVHYVKPDGGFFVWCTLPEGVSASELANQALEYGVEILPGPRCYADGSGDNCFRLAFSFQSEERIVEGIRRLGRALRNLH
jgi:2-aminoadipate transaminase